jgi:hypothetical protein
MDVGVANGTGVEKVGIRGNDFNIFNYASSSSGVHAGTSDAKEDRVRDYSAGYSTRFRTRV